MTPAFWSGRPVLVTGHTGFKGAWLCSWLKQLGASVSGLALAPQSDPCLYSMTALDKIIDSRIADINDCSAINSVLTDHKPEVVFHLAAQALVRASYLDPVNTFTTNVTGVATLLNAIRHIPSVKAVVIVTSDKCYENNEWAWGYRETDALGGRDPYSASKGCAEIVARSMQRSYFAPYAANGHHARVATVRAGNVIGGGDWSENRLVPDIVRGCLSARNEVNLRNPYAVRPWQHVLEPLHAYLTLAEALFHGIDGVDRPWNIGPDPADSRPVLHVAESLIAALGTGRIVINQETASLHEAALLMLDCSLAKSKLGWRSRFNFEDAVAFTAAWYAAWHRGEDMAQVTCQQIAAYGSMDAASPPVGASKGEAR